MMDNKIQVFNFEEQGIRTMLIDGKPFFVGKDIAKTLGYKKPLNALATHVDEDDSLKQGLTDSLGRVQETIVINESGLYSLIMASQLPEAKKFKHWVTSEVLPAIRKHGAYMTDQKIEEILSDPDTIIKLATELKAEREARLIAEQRVNELTPKASYYDLVLLRTSPWLRLLRSQRTTV